MAIFDEVSKHAAYISLKLGKLKKNTPEYDATQSTKEAILALGKELAITNGTNSPIITEKSFKSRPMPSCRVTHSVAQTIPHNTVTTLAFNTTVWDDLGVRNDKSARFHSDSVNNSRLYVHKEGKYRVTFYGSYDNPGGGVVGFYAFSIQKTDKDGNRFVLVQQGDYGAGAIGGTTFDPVLSLSVEAYLFPGEYLEALAFQANSGGVSTVVNTQATAGGITYLSPDFYITGPIGEDDSTSDVTTHFRPNSNAVPRTAGEGGGGVSDFTPKCRVYNSANISIPNVAETALTFDSERFDVGGMHSTSSNTGRITFNVAGTYMCGFHVQMENGTYSVDGRIRLNGTTKIAGMATNVAGFNAMVSVVTLYNFSAGDWIDAAIYQNSGGALNALNNGNFSPEFWATLIPELYPIS